MNKSRNIKAVFVIAIAVVLLIGSTAVVGTVAAAKKAKLKVFFTDVGAYFGTVNLRLTNDDRGTTLIDKTVDFAQLHASQGIDNCCLKSFKYSSHGSQIGDALILLVTGGGGSWSDNSISYKKHLSLSEGLDEIGCDNCG